MAKVCVVGAGAIGGIVAARMAMAGHEVGVVARGEHLAAIRAGGLRFDDRLTGESHRVPMPASGDPAAFGLCDLVVLGLKGPAVPAMLPRLAPLLGPSTIVVPALNGIPWWYFHRDRAAPDDPRIACLDPDGGCARALDPDRVIGCVVHVAGVIVEPGRVAHTANPAMILGEPDNSSSERVRRVAGWWRDSGFDTRISQDIRQDIWVKLLGNVSFNPVAAITGYLANQIIDDPEILELIRVMIDEAKRVAAAWGVPIDMDFETRIEMARSIGAAKLSMLQDFDAGRRPEIEGIIGSVIELAQRADIEVPALRHVRALVTARARVLGLLG